MFKHLAANVMNTIFNLFLSQAIFEKHFAYCNNSLTNSGFSRYLILISYSNSTLNEIYQTNNLGKVITPIFRYCYNEQTQKITVS